MGKRGMKVGAGGTAVEMGEKLCSRVRGLAGHAGPAEGSIRSWFWGFKEVGSSA